MSPVRGVAAVLAGGLSAMFLLAPGPASALQTSTIEFTNPAPITAEFASDWSTRLTVNFTTPDFSVPAPPSQGTVDVYVEGISGAWATGLPINADGSVYVSQPLAQPLLPAGPHSLNAIFVPNTEAFLGTSQTTTPLVVTITPLAVSGAIDMVDDEESSFPLIRATLSGAYVDAMGGDPAGTWSFTVTDATGESVFDTNVPVEQGEKNPLGVALTANLKPGATYTVEGAFEPVAELAGGVTVGDIAPITYTEGAASGSSSLTLPLWAVIVSAIVILALATIAVVLAVRLRPTPSIPTDQEST